MDENTTWLIIKIIATVGSVLLLLIFKKQLVRMITNVVVGGDSESYEGKTYTEVREEIEKKMDRVLE